MGPGAREVRGPRGWAVRTAWALVLVSLAVAARGAATPEVRPARAGVALRMALAALAEGRTEWAIEALEQLAREHALIADHAERFRVEALLGAGRPEEAAVACEAFAARHRGSPVAGHVARALGEARLRLGDEAGARAAFGSALDLARNDEERGELRLARGRSFERQGRLAEALTTYVRLWSQLPTTTAAGEAGAALERLEASGELRARTARLWAARATALTEAHANEEALAAAERALGGPLPPDLAREQERERAFLLFRLRRYPDAAAAFAALGDDAEDRFWHARALARSGRIQDAIASFEALGGQGGLLAARALFLSGTLREGEDDGDGARALFERLAEGAPSTGLRAAARWRLGWSDYRSGDHASAAAHFDALVQLEEDPLARLAGTYWSARARLAAGQDAGREALRSLARDYPLSYYGWRAASRVGAAGIARREPPPATAAPERHFPAGALARLRILLEAGLVEEARVEIDDLASGRLDLRQRLALAEFASEAADFHRAQRLIVDAAVERLARGPEPGREELWWYGWPKAFAGAVEAGAARTTAPAELVYAVMREESGYRADVVSLVGARGLTQIMPATGEKLATELGLSAYGPDDLFDPEHNLALGAHYLGQLLERFEGRNSAAVAAYNAGPRAVARWLREHGGLEDDEWVEAIPYEQTRGYVKRVLRSLHAYRVLY